MGVGSARTGGIENHSGLVATTPGSADAARPAASLRWLWRVEWGLVALAYLAVLFAWNLPSVYERVGPVYASVLWLAVMIRTFAFHGAIVVAALVLITLLRRRWRLAAAMTPLVVFGIAGDAAELVRARPAPSGPTLRVMSLNLFVGKADPAATLAEIARIDPDIVCLQEFNTRANAALSDALRQTHPYSVSESTERVRGVGIFSRLPIDEAESEIFTLDSNSGPQLRARVRWGDDVSTVYSVHLATPSKGPRFSRQRAQFGTLLRRLEAERTPLIVCGDFNATNRTDYGDTLAAIGLRDANACAGAGRQSTWPAWRQTAWLPRVRIDHIYLSEDFSARRAIVGQPVGSDHSPIAADIGWLR